MKKITSQTILGILGGGQLARMTCISASTFGLITHVYCSESEIGPAEHAATKTFKGSLHDREAILSFAETCDYITLENEFIDQGILEIIDQKYPGKLFPDSKTFKMVGDKISEKENFKKAGLNIVPYSVVKKIGDIERFAKLHGYPVVLKSSKGGYDGYGNATINSSSEINDKFSLLKDELLVEAFIPFEKELAIIVARNKNNEIVTYPIAHTVQENHICHFVSVPADISLELASTIEFEAKKAMVSIDAIGVFAFEFFLTKEGKLYLNESAPRPHNSGHYSIEGCITSQFENHVRSVLNLPLGKTDLCSPQVIMLNLLGTKNQISQLNPINEFLEIPNGHLHLYGKKLSKPGRKMGHFTLLGSDKNQMFTTLQKLKSEYSL